MRTRAYGPLTYLGALYVDNLLVWNYTHFDYHHVTHFLSGELQTLSKLVESRTNSENEVLRWYLRTLLETNA